MSGYLCINNDVFDDELARSEPFSRWQAYVDLIHLANYAPGYVWCRGIKINVARGQCGWSKTRLANRWRWSRKKVDGFFKFLEREGKISTQGAAKGEAKRRNIFSPITICNYEQIVTYNEEEKAAEEQQKSSRRAAEDAHNNKSKEKKKKGESHAHTRDAVTPPVQKFGRKKVSGWIGISLQKKREQNQVLNEAEENDLRLFYEQEGQIYVKPPEPEKRDLSGYRSKQDETWRQPWMDNPHKPTDEERQNVAGMLDEMRRELGVKFRRETPGNYTLPDLPVDPHIAAQILEMRRELGVAA